MSLAQDSKANIEKMSNLLFEDRAEFIFKYLFLNKTAHELAIEYGCSVNTANTSVVKYCKEKDVMKRARHLNQIRITELERITKKSKI